MPSGLPEHDTALAGDTLTTLIINYKWRRLISDALQNYADSILEHLPDAEWEDFDKEFQDLLGDFYTADIVDSTPVGSVVWYPSATIPTKWLKCNGATYSQASYPELYDILYEFRSGTNFHVPDLQNRFVLGHDVDSPAVDIGGIGGSDTHTLTTTEMPSHTHTYAAADSPAGAQQRATRAAATNIGTLTTNASGGGAAHNNMPPFMRGYFIIKALP